MSVAMSCHLTSTHFHLLRVLAGRAERSAAREAIFIQRARLCLWTAHPEPAQRHRAHASGIERSAWHFKKSGGGVGSRKQLSQGHPPQSVDCPGRQTAGLSFGHEEEEIRALWKAAHQKVLLDETWLSVLLSQPPAPSAQISVEQSGGAQVGSTPTPPQTSLALVSPPGQRPPPAGPVASSAEAFSGPLLDWGDALDVPSFFGRQGELATLSEWLVQDHCRVVSVLGLGGIGKSALVVQAMRVLAPHFDVVLFRSLRDAPPPEVLLSSCLAVLAPEAQDFLHESLERRLSRLLAELRRLRVLLVLDNLEALLEEGEALGRLRPGYEGYGQLLEQVGHTGHQSCLLLTSREHPAALRALEGRRALVRSLRLSGLAASACAQLLGEHELVGSPEEYARLAALYAGNPLALSIVAETIADLFGGAISSFLSAGTILFNSITHLLQEQWARLSPLEQMVLWWLAILREPVSARGVARGAGGAAFARTDPGSRGWATPALASGARATRGQLHPASGGAGVRDRPAGRGGQPGDRAGAALTPSPVCPLSSPGQNVCARDPGTAAAHSPALAPREPRTGGEPRWRGACASCWQRCAGRTPPSRAMGQRTWWRCCGCCAGTCVGWTCRN